MTDNDVMITLVNLEKRCSELQKKCDEMQERVESQKGMCECCGRRVPLLYVINPRTYAPREFCKDCYRGYTAGMMDGGIGSKIVEWTSDNPILTGAIFGCIGIVALLIARCVGVI